MNKKDAARILYFEGTSQKQISKIIGISETTISAWKKKGAWEDKLNKYNNIQETNEDIVKELIHYQLRAIKKLVDEWKYDTENGAAPPKLIQKGEIDALSKLYATIKKKDVQWTNYVQIIKEFMNWLQIRDLETAKVLIDLSNEFLNEKRSDL